MNKFISWIPRLRVFVSLTADNWFAQGIDLDYFSDGDSPDDVEEAFITGMIRTLELNFNKQLVQITQHPDDWYRTILELIGISPQDIQESFYLNCLASPCLARTKDIMLQIEIDKKIPAQIEFIYLAEELEKGVKNGL